MFNIQAPTTTLKQDLILAGLPSWTPAGLSIRWSMQGQTASGLVVYKGHELPVAITVQKHGGDYDVQAWDDMSAREWLSRTREKDPTLAGAYIVLYAEKFGYAHSARHALELAVDHIVREKYILPYVEVREPTTLPDEEECYF